MVYLEILSIYFRGATGFGISVCKFRCTKGLGSRLQCLQFYCREMAPIMANQMENKVEHEMEAGGFIEIQREGGREFWVDLTSVDQGMTE